MARFNETITRIDELRPAVVRGAGADGAHRRAGQEVMVGVGETMLAPVAATENAVRRVFGRLRP